MSNPTTPFSWQMPTSTDLVTDLPADFEVFGQAVATSMADLLGGTTGQVLAKTSATDMDFTWTTPQVGDITGVTAGVGITGGGTSGTVTVTNDMATTITTNGDLIYGTGSGTYTRRAIGSTGQVLTVAAGVPSWATVAPSALTLITNSSFSAVSSHSINSCFTSTYTNYKIIINLTAVSSTPDMNFRLRAAGTDTSANYNSLRLYGASGGGAAADLNNNGTDDLFKWFMDNTDVQNTFCTMEVYSPQKALKTSLNAVMSSRSGGGEYYITPYWGMQTGTTQFDGITMLCSVGTMTGSIKVYGYGE